MNYKHYLPEKSYKMLTKAYRFLIDLNEENKQ